jgi:RecJ-like exonuclease
MKHLKYPIRIISRYKLKERETAMKTIMFIAVFLLTAAAFSFAQDIKEKQNAEKQEIQYTIREAVCPDCQGWGWILGKGYYFGRNKPPTSNSESMNLSTIRQSTVDLQLIKLPCYLCSGKGFVHVREPKK